MVGLAADAAQLILGAGQLSQRWSIRWLFPTLPERKLRWLPAPGRTQLVLLLTAARRRWLDILVEWFQPEPRRLQDWEDFRPRSRTLGSSRVQWD